MICEEIAFSIPHLVGIRGVTRGYTGMDKGSQILDSTVRDPTDRIARHPVRPFVGSHPRAAADSTDIVGLAFEYPVQ